MPFSNYGKRKGLKTKSENTEIYLGRVSGKELLNSIDGAKKSIKIVSPYLTASYVSRIVRLAKKGIKVTLITSDEVPETEKEHWGAPLSHKDIIRQERHTNLSKQKERKRNLIITSFSMLLLILISYFLPIIFSQYLLQILAIYTIVGLALVISFNMRIYTYSYYSLFRVKVFHYSSLTKKEQENYHFIHSKVYVIDDNIAYVGSSNYTHAGMVKNYEVIIKIKDIAAVRKISNEVNVLFSKKDLKFRDITEWGKDLYLEPAH